MNHLYCGNSRDFMRRYGAAIAVVFGCSQCIAKDMAFGPTELAAAVTPCIPSGWSISVKDQQVVLERDKQIEIYNSLQMPPSNHEEEIRRRMQKLKLVISLRVERRMSQEQYEDIVVGNKVAYENARKDNPKQIFFRPDSRYWQDHPEYNYYHRELPSFDLGHHSVVMTSQPEFVIFVGRRVVRPRGNYLFMFKDAKVEAECQGIIDKLGKLWRTYRVAD
jgi:hypothetical protein